uniref:Phosphoenolpyruvate synthase n=2 Tax=Lutzomyia longipalpis TaxID=7200 RepID=A0A1B0CHV1_LUTLO
MDVLALMQPLGILAASFVGFVVIFNRRSKKHRSGHYTLPGWNFFLKQRWAERRLRKRFKEEDPGEEFFISHPDDEVHAIEKDIGVESLQFYGTDSQGNELLVKISRRKGRVADVILSLRLESGETLTLPQHPDTRISSANTEEAFEAAGLRYECLVPNSNWRITFAGYLRREIRKTWSAEVHDDDLIFVRFNFIWGAANEPLSWPWNWSPKMMASALATEPWLDGKWINMVPMSTQGVDQFGSLRGQITIGESAPKEVVLPGIREKRWGIERTDYIHRTANFLVSCYDGLIFTLNTKSFSKGLTHVQSGLVRLPCGEVYPIDWSDFHISTLAEHPASLPRGFTFRFSGAGRTFTVVLHFLPEKILPLQGGRPLEWFSHHVPFEVTVNGIPGRGSVQLHYPESYMDISLPHQREEPRIRKLRYKEIKPNPGKLVVRLSDIDAQSVAVAGGKGASLALLTCATDNGTFSVPMGFVVTSSAYRQQMNGDQDLGRLLDRLVGICEEEIKGNLREVCEEVVAKIQSMDVKMQIRLAIEEVLGGIIQSECEENSGDFEIVREMRYAIRSSGISEDGSDASAAGQNETFLGVSTVDEIHRSIVKCWASLYTYQSVQYRRQNTQPIITEMAVVVQQMVAADVAGVLFTRHPSTGNPSHVLITSNYGLGESVVSGEVDPDVFVVKRNYHDTKFTLVETKVGKKEYKIKMASNGREVEKIPLDEDVQTSGISEDGRDASAAGQNETFLGVSTVDEIHRSIVKCWASLYTYQGVQYRRQNTQPIITEMAVVVQQMVAADVAGVLFTRHPSTGNPSHVLITSNYGLGESVVSGEVDPDVFVVKRNYHDTKFTLVETKVGKKEYKIKMASNGREVEKIPLDEDVQTSTTLNWELAHEFDYPIMSPQDARSTANVQEVFPGCTAPLSLFTVAKMIDEASFTGATGLKASTRLFNVFWITMYQLGFEMYNLFLRQPDEKISMLHKVFGMAVLGRDFITKEVLSIGIHRRGITGNWIKFKMMVKTIVQFFNNGNRSARGVSLTNSFRNEYSPESLERFSTASELYEDITKNMVQLYEMSGIHGIVSQVSVLSQVVLMMIMVEGAESFTEDHFNDLAIVLKCSKEVESAEIPKSLAEIGRIIYTTGKAEEFHKIPPKDAIGWLERNCREAHKLFVEFIAKNHHRGLKEFDLATETWGMRPEIVIEMIQANVRFGKAPTAAVTEDSRDIVDQLRSPKKGLSKFFLRRLVSLLKKSVQRRELSKSNLIAVVNEFRMGFRHLGRLMVAEGRLPDFHLIFYLVPAEIERLLRRRDARIVHKASRRRRLLTQWEHIQFPELATGIPRPINHQATTPPDGGECIVQGTTVYPGLITARACAIKSFAEVDQIQSGDILITYSTDIGWSPYFPMLSAVVTEIGGLISHGAVVAREYGLPCIVAARGATDYFRTGDMVTLDAGRGVIFRTESAHS